MISLWCGVGLGSDPRNEAARLRNASPVLYGVQALPLSLSLSVTMTPFRPSPPNVQAGRKSSIPSRTSNSD